MTSSPHPGEVEARRRAGVLAPDRTPSFIRSEFPPIALRFLEAQTSAFLGFADTGGSPWVIPVAGTPGFLKPLDERTIRIDVAERSTHPLLGGLSSGHRMGSLVVDFETRDRVRINGIVESVSDDGLVLAADEVFSNCPKYIQTRAPASGRFGDPLEARNGVDEEFRSVFGHSDALFLVSGNEELGFDVSHRGGRPGFLHWDGDTLVLPDYQGNRLFQTIGNLTVDPRIGILAIDFATGDSYHGTGRAYVDWGPTADPAVERQIRITVEDAVALAPSSTWVAPTIEMSPYLPALVKRDGKIALR